MLLSADCEEFSERRTLFLFIFVAVINGLIFMAVETNRIEYKQCLTEDLEKEAVAFLNYREGGVYAALPDYEGGEQAIATHF